jgi:hypothetical protein
MAGTNLTLNDILGDGLEKGLERISAKMQELDGLMKSINKESKAIAGAVKESSGTRGTSGSDLATRKKQLADLTDATQKLSLVQSESDKLQRQRQTLIVQQNELLKDNQIALQKEKQALSDRNKTLQAGAGSLREMETRLNGLRREYANLSAAERQATQTGGALLKNIQSLGRETDQLRLKMGQAQQRVGGYAAAIKEVGGAFAGQIGLYGGIAGGIALISNAFASGLNIIKNYSSEWSKLRALVGSGVSGADLSALQKSANVGGDLGKSATDVTKLQIELARFGLTARQIVDVTPGILKLSAVTGEDLANSASTVAANLKSFNLEANQSERVVGVLARVFNESASGLSDFAESSKYAAPSAKSAGVSIEFMSAAIAKLADRGIKGSMAGTALRRIFTEMAGTGKSASEAWAELTKRGINLASAQDDVGLTAMNALQILSENRIEVEKFSKSLENVAKNTKVVEDGIAIMTNNLTGDINKLSASYENLWLSIDKGDGVLSKISRAVIQLGTDFLDTFNKMTSDPTKVAAGVPDYVKQQAKTAFMKPGGALIDDKLARTNIKEFYDRASAERQSAQAEMIRLDKSLLATPDEVFEAKKTWQELLNIENYWRDLLNSNAARQEVLTKKTLDAVAAETDAKEKSTKAEKEQLNLRQKYYDLLKKHGFLVNEEIVENELKLLKRLYSAGAITLDEATTARNQIFGNVSQAKPLSGQIPQKGTGLKTPTMQAPEDRFNLINALAGDTNEVWDFFGVQKDQQGEMTDKLNNVVGLAKDVTMKLFDIRQNAIDKEIRQREDRINEIENLLQREYDLQRQAQEKGDAFDDARLKSLQKQKEKEEQLKKDALAKETKLNEQRAALDQLAIGRAIVVSIANVIKGWSSLPFVGRVLGVAEVAILLAQFATLKKQANSLSKAEKGTSGTFGGALHSENSDNRGMIYDGNGRQIETERGEAFGVLSRSATSKYGRQFYDFVENANSGKNPLQSFANYTIFAKTDNRETVKEIRKTNELLSRMPVQRGNEFSTLAGNVTIRRPF